MTYYEHNYQLMKKKGKDSVDSVTPTFTITATPYVYDSVSTNKYYIAVKYAASMTVVTASDAPSNENSGF